MSNQDPTLPAIPAGLQKLLRLASVDEPFREQLIRRRAAVAPAAGVQLTANEERILQSIPDGQIRVLAEGMPPPAPQRREFLRQSAATAVVLLGGAVLSQTLTGCRDTEIQAADPAAQPEPEPVADDAEQPAPEEAGDQGEPEGEAKVRRTSLPAIGGCRADVPGGYPCVEDDD